MPFRFPLLRSRLPERALFSLGAALLVFAVGTRLSATYHRARDIRRFDAAIATAPAGAPAAGGGLVCGTQPDTSLWSPQRIKAYAESQATPAGPALAVLAIPKIRLEVPVLDGTDELTLNRAVGLIEETACPGEAGNVAIAGHRDGFFRGLKDVGPGDAIILRTPAGPRAYLVKTVCVVDPDDVSVLDETPTDVLTLVTCYPFYYVGSAPQRFIVRAERTNPAAGLTRSSPPGSHSSPFSRSPCASRAPRSRRP
jgi:sortase A